MLRLNHLTETTLPKLFASKFGNVFVPNGKYIQVSGVNE